MTDDIIKIITEITAINKKNIQNPEFTILNSLDSLQFIRLIVSLEENFNITIEPDEFEQLKSINDIKELIQKKQ